MGAFFARRLSPIALGAALCAITALSACSSKMDTKLEASGAARISVNVSVPGPLAAKFRSLQGAKMDSRFFDPVTVKKSLLARKGVQAVIASTPTPDSLSLDISVSDIKTALEAPDFANLVTLRSVSGDHVLSFRLSREHGKDMGAFLLGVDPALLEALSPPALGGEDYTRQEYREALGSILGTRVLPALDAAALEFSTTVTGSVKSAVGGRVEGSTWSFSIPLLDVLVLEKPIEYSLTWR